MIAGLLLRRGDADAMICGTVGRYHVQLRHVNQVIGKGLGVQGFSTVSGLILQRGPLFIADTFVSVNPTSEKLAEITLMAADKLRDFGIEPKIALLSHSNFGTENTETATKMREVLQHLHEAAPDLEVEGEMQADAAITPFIREEVFPNSRLSGVSEFADHADARCRKYCVQPVEGGFARHGTRAYFAWCKPSGARRHTGDLGTRPAQHERDCDLRSCDARGCQCCWVKPTSRTPRGIIVRLTS